MKNVSLIFAGAVALAASAHAAVVADLDAAATPRGEISDAQDKATGGRWNANVPLRADKVQGRPAFVLDGTQQLISEFILGSDWEKKAFTVEAWALNPLIDKAETVVVFAPARGGSGTEFAFSTGPSAGAFRSGFKATTPFANVPSPNVWHHLAWTYGGITDGTLRVYVDGELDVERSLKFTLPPQARIHVGASGDVDNKGPRKAFSGAIARVRVHDTALTQAELRQGAGFVAAFGPLPRNNETTDALHVPLRWQCGSPAATSYAVYAGTDRSSIERGEISLARHVATPELELPALTAGAAYFWRVDQLDKSGQLIAPGQIWTFVADPGLATAPQPRHNDSNVASTMTQLAWTPGKYATRQRLFFSTSAGEAAHAGAPAAEMANRAESCTVPAKLEPGTRYFWRIDSDNGAQPPSRGPIWTFRTQDAPQKNDVTFFVGSDTHYGRENNAAINRRVIDEMNALPGTSLPALVGGGFVRTPRGVVLNGDLLDEGFNPQSAPGQWAEFCRDYGLTGRDGRLCFPLYEGFGNHDGGPAKSFVRAGIKERNLRRVGLTTISGNGLHYSWDWDQLHLVQLNLFGGSSQLDVKGVNPVEHDPESSLQFLQQDLSQHVGASGRPLITFQHFAWQGGMSDWWHPEAKERFYNAVKPYHVLCLINGHSHGADFVSWHEFLTIHDGSTARGESDTGDFMVVHVTDSELMVIQRKLGAWGIFKRQPRTLAR